MPRASALLLAAGLCAIPAHAGSILPTAGACTAQKVSDYIGLGSTGCTVGPLTYFDFFYMAIPSGPVSVIAQPGDIDVTPPLGLGSPIEFTSENFTVGSGEKMVYILSYTIDPPPDILPGFDLEFETNTPVKPGSATITAYVCAGGNLIRSSASPDFIGPNPRCEPTGDPEVSGFNGVPHILEVFHKGLPLGPGDVKFTDSVLFDPATNYVNVWLRIDLDGGPAGAGGSADIDGVKASTPAPLQEVPEPGAWILMGAGLGVFGLLRLRHS